MKHSLENHSISYDHSLFFIDVIELNSEDTCIGIDPGINNDIL